MTVDALLSENDEAVKKPWIAFKFLTLAGRFGRAPGTPEEIGGAAAYFPVVGALLGLVLVFLNRVLEPLVESEIDAAVLILALIIMTAAIHLEGTQKTFDWLMAPKAGAGITIYGIVAVILVVTLKIRSLEVMGETRNINLLLAPVLARWALVVFLYGPAWSTDQSAWRLAERVTAWHLIFSSAATLAFAGYLTGRAGLWCGLCVSVLALLARRCFQRREHGVHHANLGAVVEISETLSLILLASL